MYVLGISVASWILEYIYNMFELEVDEWVFEIIEIM